MRRNTYIIFSTNLKLWICAWDRFRGLVLPIIITYIKHVYHFEANSLFRNWRIKKPPRCHLIFYCTSYRLNMFRALVCPSPGARDYDVVYHIGRVVLGLLYVGRCRLKHLCLSLQPGRHSSLTVPHFQPTANQERHDQCGKHHSHELLMMGIVILETCWTYKKYNKVSSGI